MVMTMRMCFAVALLLFYFNMHDLDTKLQTGRTRYNILRGAVASVSSAAGRILGGSSSRGSRNKRHRTVAACADIDDTGEDNESSEDTTINEKLASIEVENESLRKTNITLNQKLVVANDKKIALDDAVELVTTAINKELDDPAIYDPPRGRKNHPAKQLSKADFYDGSGGFTPRGVLKRFKSCCCLGRSKHYFSSRLIILLVVAALLAGVRLCAAGCALAGKSISINSIEK